MEFRVLGSLQVVADDGSVISIPQRLIRRAICVLVVHADRALPRTELMELLSPDAQSDGALRTCRYTIRRLIGDQRLVREGDASRLRLVAGDRTDLGAFRKSVAAAEAATDRGERALAAELLASAVEWWRDPRLPDLPDNIAAQEVRDRLIAELRRAREALVRTLFDLGWMDELIGQLENKVGDEPLNESAWRQLMLALYRDGRPAEALHAYDRARSVLETEAGVEPGVPLQQLRDQIHKGDPALLSLPGAPPVVARRVPRLRQLPPDVPNFTGRTAELLRLRTLLTTAGGEKSTPPIAVITGLPGAGKTSLAVRAARLVADAFPDGQAFVQLAGSSAEPRDPRNVLGELLRALGAGPALPDTLAERTALYRSELAGRRMLLVVDDAATYAQVLPLLPGSLDCAVIVTSRYQSVSPAGELFIHLARLTDGDALELLARIIGRARVDAEPGAAAQLVASCGGSPLAVRIAGARLAAMKTWPVSHMSSLLTDTTRLLDQLKVGDLAVRQVIGTGYALLDPREQAACRRLALIGPHDVAAWTVAVLLGEPSADDVVDRLVDTSLLQPVGVGASGEPRYRLHDLVRAYSTERLADDPERDVALERLLAALLELTDLADAHLPRDPHYWHFTRIDQRHFVNDKIAELLMAPGARVWLESERLVILAAISAACQAGHIRLATGIALRLDAFLQTAGYREDAPNLWRTLVNAGETVLQEQADRPAATSEGEDQTLLPENAILVERIRYRLATALAANRAQPDQALPMLDRCITAFEQASLPADLSRALYMRAYCLQELGRLPDARSDADRALQLARRSTDRRTEALALSVLGLVCSQEGRHEQARDHCLAAVEISRDLGEVSYEVLTLYRLINVEHAAGHLDRVLELCEQGFALSDKIGHSLGNGYFHLKTGHALREQGAYREAIPHLDRALSVFLSQGASRLESAHCRRDLAETYLTLAEHTAARPHLEQCVKAFRALGLADEEKHAAAGLSACIAELDVTRPNIARIYDYLLGGEDNFPADRSAGEQILQVSPGVRELVQNNRAFLGRVVRFLVAEMGIRQFIDIGTGLPTRENVHDITDTTAPDARIVYVDNDPEVVAHAAALLAGRHTTTAIEGDVRRPEAILADPRLHELIDFNRPAAVLLLMILHFVPDDANPAGLVQRLTAPLAPGSYLAISHSTPEGVDAEAAAAGRSVYKRSSAGLHLRSAAEVNSFFAGFQLVEPGLGWIRHWRPDGPGPTAVLPGDIVGGLAYKPAPGGTLTTPATMAAAVGRQPR